MQNFPSPPERQKNHSGLLCFNKLIEKGCDISCSTGDLRVCPFLNCFHAEINRWAQELQALAASWNISAWETKWKSFNFKLSSISWRSVQYLSSFTWHTSAFLRCEGGQYRCVSFQTSNHSKTVPAKFLINSHSFLTMIGLCKKRVGMMHDEKLFTNFLQATERNGDDWR